jgi:hypothetical protein
LRRINEIIQELDEGELEKKEANDLLNQNKELIELLKNNRKPKKQEISDT